MCIFSSFTLKISLCSRVNSGAAGTAVLLKCAYYTKYTSFFGCIIATTCVLFSEVIALPVDPDILYNIKSTHTCYYNIHIAPNWNVTYEQ